MKLYRLPDGQTSAANKKLLRFTGFFSLLICVAVFPFLYFSGLGSFQNLDAGPMALTVGFVMAVMLVSIVSSLRRLRKQQHLAWRTYELSLTDDAVVRRQGNASELRINRDEITTIKEYESGRLNEGLVIRCSDKRKFIHVPRMLEGYDEARSILGDWAEIRAGSNRGRLAVASIMVLGLLATYAAFFLSHHPAVVIPAGLVIVVSTFCSVIEFRRQSVRAMKGWLLYSLLAWGLLLVAGRLLVLLMK